MEAVARLNSGKGSPRKVRLVADMIRGMGVEKALSVLRYSAKEASKEMEKVVLSAVNNWEVKNEPASAEDSDLYVKEIYVDGGKMLKRFRPAPFGRAHRIRKRTHHITVVVDSKLPMEFTGEEVTAETEPAEQVK